MNLNKFTKAELINKFKKLENENSNKTYLIKTYLIKFLNYILLFKNFLLKITLITLIIKIFKKYSLIRRLWTIINTIIVSIFGISLIDNFGFKFVSDFLTEIRFITYSVINYLSNTQFYSFIAGLFSAKENVTNPSKTEIRDRLNEEFIRQTERNKESFSESKGNSKISEWLKPDPIQNQNPENNLKTIIFYGFIFGISCALTYYYWEDITPYISSIPAYAASAWDWIKGRRPGNPPDNTRVNLTQEERDLLLNENFAKIRKMKDEIAKTIIDKGKLKERFPPEEQVGSSSKLPDDKPIELIVNKVNPYFVDSNKSPVLTSPSLDDLNSKVMDSWKRTTSPTSSTSSTETIKPIELPINSTSSTSESIIENIASSESIITEDDLLESITSLSLTISDNSKGFINATKLKHVDKITGNNWKDNITENTLNSMNIVENFFSDSKPKLTDAKEMTHKFLDILQGYNWVVEYYLKHPDISVTKRQLLKDMASQMRIWLNENYWRVFPKDFKTVTSGKLTDSPKKFINELLEDLE